ncbi:hypothetical protein [Nitrosococcus wardiae]|uniref:Uncharacterized protein n=1 Tax=Nitrosococcus wardiae TaxID=1814290 RepID=A0A4V1AVJ7_9GAMM|nr:hypothetical protein [Nitrosococcus wardiae]QBQ53375.1 hypothetical protein E3U44_01780 [Nitrosococcus wardiae]
MGHAPGPHIPQVSRRKPAGLSPVALVVPMAPTNMMNRANIMDTTTRLSGTQKAPAEACRGLPLVPKVNRRISQACGTPTGVIASGIYPGRKPHDPG